MAKVQIGADNLLEWFLHLSEALQNPFKDVGTPLRGLGGYVIILSNDLQASVIILFLSPNALPRCDSHTRNLGCSDGDLQGWQKTDLCYGFPHKRV